MANKVFLFMQQVGGSTKTSRDFLWDPFRPVMPLTPSDTLPFLLEVVWNFCYLTYTHTQTHTHMHIYISCTLKYPN